MLQLKILSYLICLHGLIGSLYAADKYTDENRPYEFGFTIDGEQHRHEKKDENGIIMGEFGFITADGVYHVTVYATDENGRFKILSMKNIRVKPYPTAGGGVKKGHSIPFPPSKNAPVLQGPSSSKTLKPQQESKPVQTNKQISSPAKSCSHCSLPTTTTKAPPKQLTDIAVVAKDRPISDNSEIQTPHNYQQNTPISSFNRQSNLQGTNNEITNPTLYSGQQNQPPSTNYNPNNPNYHEINSPKPALENTGQNYQQQNIFGNSPPSQTNLNYYQQNNNDNHPTNQYLGQKKDNIDNNNPLFGNDGLQSSPPNRSNGGRSYSQEESNVFYNNPGKAVNNDQDYHQQQNNPNYPQSGIPLVQPQTEPRVINKLPTLKETSRNPKQYNDISYTETNQPQGFGDILASAGDQPVSDRPTLVVAQMQIVPKDTDIYHRNPGEEEGLPSGLSKDDMNQLLYTFNYTVGFHGHHEEGYSNGAKKGYYYVTGRNGIRTRVDYVADEKGFRPKISQEVLDLLSDDVPKPETEKDEKFGLKGYEFKWLYFPTHD